MKKSLISMLLISISISQITFAALTSLNGAQLLTYCQAAADILDDNFGRVQTQSEYIQGSKAGMCEGYLMSVSETQRFCFPVHYHLALGAAVVVKYLKQHPQEHNQNANVLIAKAFNTFFPCQHYSNAR